MEFYQSISAYYDYIFPLNQAQLAFIGRFIQGDNLKLLDVGCSTGSLAIELARNGSQVWAFDFDDEMVSLAEQKKISLGLIEFPVFSQSDMRLIEQNYPARFFDAVTCFGNTIVHLINNEEISLFLNGAYMVLKPGGKLLLQLLNYESILKDKPASLPLIENEQVRFDRFYEFPGHLEWINFITRLEVKQNGQIIENNVKLYPLTKEKLDTLLLQSGFREIQFFGSFKGEPLQKDSLPLVVSATK